MSPRPSGKQTDLTINEPDSILKTPSRRSNHSGMLWLFFRGFDGRTPAAVTKTNSMNTGSSPDTGTDLHGSVITITEPPIMEIDTEATVARTEPFGSARGLVMLDFHTKGNVVRIEIDGQFTRLAKSLPRRASRQTPYHTLLDEDHGRLPAVCDGVGPRRRRLFGRR